MIHLVVRLFPRAWWARYGDEFLALLDDQPRGRRRWADILRCLVAAHLDRPPRPTMLARAIALLILLAIAVSAAFLVAIVGAILLHQVLVLTVGEERIPYIDGTFAMTALLLLDYAIALVAGVAIFAFGWARFVRPRT